VGDEFDHHMVTSLRQLSHLWRTRALSQEPRQHCKLLSLLDSFHHFGCADERDKLFTLCNLATDFLNQDSTYMDYSLAVDDLYTKFAISRMKQGETLAILSRAGSLLAGGNRSLASWVPDWSGARQHNPMFRSSRDAEQHPKWKVVEDGSLLLSAAFYVLCNSLSLDSVQVGVKGPSCPQKYEPHAMLQWIRESYSVLRSNTSIDIAALQIGYTIVTCAADNMNLDANADTAALDSIASAGAPWGPRSYASLHQHARKVTELLQSHADAPFGSIEPYLKSAHVTSGGRCLFVTKSCNDTYDSKSNGVYVGICPEVVGSGDIIVAFAETSIPFFLHPCDAGRYRLLGDGHIASEVFSEPQRMHLGKNGRLIRDAEIILV
jgi:hypothetical protein